MSTRNRAQASQHDRRNCEARRLYNHAGDAKRPDAKRPFDSTDLRRVPRPRDDDPPYRPWWVVDNGDAR